MKSLIFAFALLALTSMTAQAQTADTKSDLPCRFKAGEIAGSDSYASQVNQHHKSPSLKKAKKTSVGSLTWIQEQESGHFNIIPMINGKPIAIRKENEGTFRSGKIYDLGGKIILAYAVERWSDSRSSPSHLTVLVGPGGKIMEEYAIDGEDIFDHPCVLLF